MNQNGSFNFLLLWDNTSRINLYKNKQINQQIFHRFMKGSVNVWLHPNVPVYIRGCHKNIENTNDKCTDV